MSLVTGSPTQFSIRATKRADLSSPLVVDSAANLPILVMCSAEPALGFLVL